MVVSLFNCFLHFKALAVFKQYLEFFCQKNEIHITEKISRFELKNVYVVWGYSSHYTTGPLNAYHDSVCSNDVKTKNHKFSHMLLIELKVKLHDFF